MHLEPSSLASNKIVIHEIIIDAPDIIYEAGSRGDNLHEIQRSIETFRPPTFQPKGKSAREAKLEIGLFLVENAHVRVRPRTAGGREIVIPLPEVVLIDIGKGSGISPKEAVSKMMAAVTGSVDKVVVVAKKTKAAAIAKTDVKTLNKPVSSIRTIVESIITAVTPWAAIVQAVKKLLGK